jgi:hypothetical protein
MTGADHEHTAAIDEAARWLSATPLQDRPRPIIPAIINRFGLSPREACVAIREASLIVARAQ